METESFRCDPVKRAPLKLRQLACGVLFSPTYSDGLCIKTKLGNGQEVVLNWPSCMYDNTVQPDHDVILREDDVKLTYYDRLRRDLEPGAKRPDLTGWPNLSWLQHQIDDFTRTNVMAPNVMFAPAGWLDNAYGCSGRAEILAGLRAGELCGLAVTIWNGPFYLGVGPQRET